MQQAFSQIAGVLFEGRLLTVEILKNALRLFVIESAISGNWLYFAVRDETQGEIFPGRFGNVYVWETFNGQLKVVFTAEIAEWTAKLLERVPEKGLAGPKGKRGMTPNMKRHHDIADVVNSFNFGANWKEPSNLKKITEKMVKQHIPPSQAWVKRRPPARSWRRALEFHPDAVRKALEYSLEMAAKDNPEKLSETLANLR